MKILHTADLHIGKIVNEFSMIEDQRHILKQIIEIAVEKKVEVVIVAGDIYDRAIPSVEGVELLDEFYTQLLQYGIRVLAISGNHDSPERISFASKILREQGLHICGDYQGRLKKIVLEDEYGEVIFHFFPFIKTATASVYLEKKAVTVQQMAEEILEKDKEELDLEKRNVCISHYFVLHGNEKAEEILEREESVGGIDGIEASLFEDYDYVALGHIHGDSYMGRETIAYSGSPLKYSFSEVNQKKSVRIIELKEKGNIEIERCFLKPLHDMRVIRGELKELMKPEVVQAADASDYICAMLTDKDDLLNPMDTIRSVYPNTMQVIVEKYQKEYLPEELTVLDTREKDLFTNYQDFFELVEGEALEGEYLELMKDMIKQVEVE